MPEIEHLSLTFHVHKGDIVPGNGGFDIEIVGCELNDSKQAIGRKVGTDQYFLVEGVIYGD